MTTILHIPKPKGNSFIAWEHIIKSAVAFTGTYILLFFGTLMMSGKRGGGESLGKNIFIYLTKHPEVQIGLSVFALLVINLYVFFKNRKVKYIVEIQHDENSLQFGLTNLYYSQNMIISVPKNHFQFHIENTVSENDEKRQKIVFRNYQEGKIIGEIDTKHFLWEKHLLQLKNMISELNVYRMKV
jgi:hypothetical protein